MFLFIPVIGIVLLITFAINFRGAAAAPYDNVSLALILVFLVGPFVVSFLSYLIQFLIFKSRNASQALIKYSSLPAYLVFLSLIVPQLALNGNGSWLYTALGEITGHFSWMQIDLQAGSNFSNVMILILKKVLVISQYFFVFTIYMVSSELFKSLGSRKYDNYLPVGFLSNNRMLIFGYCFAVVTVSLEYIITYSDHILFDFALFLSPDYSLLIKELLSTLLRFSFPVLFLMFFPLLLPLIAGWKPLPEGPTLDLIKDISKKNNFTYHNVYLAGQPGLLTAGIIGVFPWTRNLMFTNDIIELLDEKEQESVLLHEIGHAKYYHIFTYLLFFMSFSVMIEFLTAGMLVLGVGESTFFLLLMSSFIAFIYYGWGWLSRLCERQADLNAAEVQGTPEYIIGSFLKLNAALGGILDKPSWHHGSLGVRIQNLENAYQDNGESRLKFHKNLKKIKGSIALFFLCVAFLFPFLIQSERQQVLFKSGLAMSQFNNSNYEGCIKTYEDLLVYITDRKTEDKGITQYAIIAHYNMACAYAKMKDANGAYINLNKVLTLLTPEIMEKKLSEKQFATDADFDYIRDSEWFQSYMSKIKKTKKAFDNKEANPFLKS